MADEGGVHILYYVIVVAGYQLEAQSLTRMARLTPLLQLLEIQSHHLRDDCESVALYLGLGVLALDVGEE